MASTPSYIDWTIELQLTSGPSEIETAAAEAADVRPMIERLKIENEMLRTEVQKSRRQLRERAQRN